MTDAAAGTRVCPQCGETIKAEAIICRFCRATFEVVRRGYCPHCRRMAASTTEGACSVCGTPLVDVRVESHPVTAAPPAPPAGTPATPPAPAAAARQKTSTGRRAVAVALVVAACAAVAAVVVLQMSRPAVRHDLHELSREMDGAHVIVTGMIHWDDVVVCTRGRSCLLHIAAADGPYIDLELFVPYDMIVSDPSVGVRSVRATEGPDIHDWNLVEVTGYVEDCTGPDSPDCFGLEAEEIVLVGAGPDG